MQETLEDKGTIVKVYIVSDQHLEFRNGKEKTYFDNVPPEGADIAIVAGDFDVARGNFEENMKTFCRMFKKVFYVPGNHDYYRSNVEDVDKFLGGLTFKIHNFLLLRTNEVHHHEGRRILGSTMWVPDCEALRYTQHLINDAKQIPNFFLHIPKKNRDFVEWLSKELREGDIVVTHHLPSDRSTPEIYRGSPSQPWFVCDMELLIHARKPAVWIHGHTHTRCEYKIGDTRIICNPAGYPSESGDLPGPLVPYIFEI
jgi:predicted phosphodiesterase